MMAVPIAYNKPSKLLLNQSMQAQAEAPKPNPEITFSQRNYFRPGTYLHLLKEQLTQRALPLVAAMTLVAPIERWRIHAQTQDAMPIRPIKIRSFFAYVKTVASEQGVRSLWRSNFSSVCIYLHQCWIQTLLYDSIKADARTACSQVPAAAPLLNHVVYPLMAAFYTLAVTHPVDTFRIHKAMSYHRTPGQAYITVFRRRLGQVRLHGLYRGFWLANVISVVQLNVYQGLLQAARSGPAESDWPIRAEHLLPVVAVAVVHPLDTLKKMFQLDNLGKPGLFERNRDVLHYLKEHKKTMCLFNGITASVVRTALFVTLFVQLSNIWRDSVNGVRPGEPIPQSQ